MSEVVAFIASCPRCGKDVRWVQAKKENNKVEPSDFRIECGC